MPIQVFCDLSLGGNTYRVEKARLKLWIKLQEIKKETNGKVGNMLCLYLSTAVNQDIEWRTLPWYEVVEAFSVIEQLNKPSLSFPILEEIFESDVQTWNYKGREWYLWAHVFASRYSWTLEHIANLEIDDAIALMQEILSEEFLQREWQYSLSEVAYSYDQGTKKSKYNPLSKPKWMWPVVPETKPVVVRKDMLPVGNVIKPKNTNHR